MLTLKQITEQTDLVIAGLKKKHFKNAEEAIAQAIKLNDDRKKAQAQLDNNLAEGKTLAAKIGQAMKAGNKEEAEQAKAKVAELKVAAADLEARKEQAENDLTALLCTIPNIPYPEVPEGTCAEDNWVVKSNLKECVIGQDTVGNWTCNPENSQAKVPHWELAKKYNLIDFDLGVKITGAGFPVYIGKGAQLQRALINFFLAEANKAGYTEIMPPTVVNPASGYGTGQLPDKEGQMYKRKNYRPPFYWWWFGPFETEEKIVEQGQTLTDEEGNFKKHCINQIGNLSQKDKIWLAKHTYHQPLTNISANGCNYDAE